MMNRRVIEAIKEDDMIHVMDLAFSHQHESKWEPRYDCFANVHLLTGIDFSGLQWQHDRGFEGDIHCLSDPRASLYAADLERQSTAATIMKSTLSTQSLLGEVTQRLAEDDNAKIDPERNCKPHFLSN
jgi:hypothetical protein